MPTDERDFVQKIKKQLSKKEKALKYGQPYKQKWLEANALHLGGSKKVENAIQQQNHMLEDSSKKRDLEAEPFSENAKKAKVNVVTTVEEARKKRLYKYIADQKLKGYVSVKTNLGDLNLEVFADMAPIASENFIGLCKKGYYNNVKFHRLISGFMVQGGDPTGSGRGGESLWGDPFDNEIVEELSHDKVGVLSMANTGKPKTNKSQFFLTFGPCTHLDGKHTIFGRLAGGLKVLKEIEAIPTTEMATPKRPIVILNVVIHEDPFQTASEKLKAGSSAVTSSSSASSSSSSSTSSSTSVEIATEDNPYLQHLKRKK